MQRRVQMIETITGVCMAFVIHSINATLSGTCHHLDAVADQAHHQYALELLRSASVLLLGRTTFDLFAQFWPSAVQRDDLPGYVVALARQLERQPKYVVSSRELTTDWPNVQRVAGLEGVRQLLGAVPGRVVVFGSPGLGASLIQAGLVHELQVMLQPYVGVQPPTLFSGQQARQSLTLLQAKPMDSGAVLLRYEVERMR